MLHFALDQDKNGLILLKNLILVILEMLFPIFSYSLQRKDLSGRVAQLIYGHNRKKDQAYRHC